MPKSKGWIRILQVITFLGFGTGVGLWATGTPLLGKAPLIASAVALVIGILAGTVLIRIWETSVRARSIAARIFGQLERGYSQLIDWQVIEAAAETPPAAFCRSIQTVFESYGFKHIADMENRGLSEICTELEAQERMRLMLGDQNTTTAALVEGHVKHRDQEPIDEAFVQLGTEFSDGTFLFTSNAPGEAEGTLEPSGIRDRRMHPTASAVEVLQLHRQCRDEILQTNCDIRPVLQYTMRDVLDSLTRWQRLKLQHMRSTIQVEKQILSEGLQCRDEAFLNQVATELVKLGQASRRCRKCGYNLTGNVSGVCPECGGRT